MVGKRDEQTVLAGGKRAAPPKIDGVQIFELGNIFTRSGWMAEVFRTDWPIGDDTTIRQVIWVELAPDGVTDWHRHSGQIDRIVGVGGRIKLALWDGRDESPTRGATEVIRIGAIRPVMVIIPPGVWHGLRNESGQPAGYLNLTNMLYVHAEPDNWRLSPSEADIPPIL